MELPQQFNQPVYQTKPPTRLDAVCKLPGVTVGLIRDVKDVALGVLATPFNILTLGFSKSLFNTQMNTSRSNRMVGTVYHAFFSILNPSWGEKTKYEVMRGEAGFCTQIVTKCFQNIARFMSEGDKPLIVREIASRPFYALSGISALSTRAIDLQLGYLGLAASLLTLGQVDSINTFAMNQLNYLGIINDLRVAISGTINPHCIKVY